ncbi:MAG: 50S ribosomal protein L30 [Bdellovibrio sp.]|nr:50S ribosomal protein L30 [Bdellovibrio sp.]
MAKTFDIKLKKSTIGCHPTQIRTIHAMGLRKINSTVTMVDNAANRGQLFKVQHMVEIIVKK